MLNKKANKIILLSHILQYWYLPYNKISDLINLLTSDIDKLSKYCKWQHKIQ